MDWPTSLPQLPLEDSFSDPRGEAVVTSPMDVGPAKVRRKFTSVNRNYQVRMALTAAQKATLVTFYQVTSNLGTTPFVWTNPRTFEPVDLYFARAPRYSSNDSEYFADLEFSLSL